MNRSQRERKLEQLELQTSELGGDEAPLMSEKLKPQDDRRDAGLHHLLRQVDPGLFNSCPGAAALSQALQTATTQRLTLDRHLRRFVMSL